MFCITRPLREYKMQNSFLETMCQCHCNYAWLSHHNPVQILFCFYMEGTVLWTMSCEQCHVNCKWYRLLTYCTANDRNMCQEKAIVPVISLDSVSTCSYVIPVFTMVIFKSAQLLIPSHSLNLFTMVTCCFSLQLTSFTNVTKEFGRTITKSNPPWLYFNLSFLFIITNSMIDYDLSKWPSKSDVGLFALGPINYCTRGLTHFLLDPLSLNHNPREQFIMSVTRHRLISRYCSKTCFKISILRQSNSPNPFIWN